MGYDCTTRKTKQTHWSETESPMIRQFGRVVDGTSAGPGEQHVVVLANTALGLGYRLINTALFLTPI
jgi:hypothetical protein